jgi:hypothetical protein
MPTVKCSSSNQRASPWICASKVEPCSFQLQDLCKGHTDISSILTAKLLTQHSAHAWWLKEGPCDSSQVYLKLFSEVGHALVKGGGVLESLSLGSSSTSAYEWCNAWWVMSPHEPHSYRAMLRQIFSYLKQIKTPFYFLQKQENRTGPAWQDDTSGKRGEDMGLGCRRVNMVPILCMFYIYIYVCVCVYANVFMYMYM